MITNNCLYNIESFETFSDSQIQKISSLIHQEVSLEIKHVINEIRLDVVSENKIEEPSVEETR